MWSFETTFLRGLSARDDHLLVVVKLGTNVHFVPMGGRGEPGLRPQLRSRVLTTVLIDHNVHVVLLGAVLRRVGAVPPLSSAQARIDEPSTRVIATVKTPSSRDRTRTSPATRGGGAVVDTSLFPSRRGEPEHT